MAPMDLGPGAAVGGLSPHFPWDEPPRSHPSRGSHRDAPGAFPWQFLSGWMGFVCSWMGAGQELAQGRIQHLQRDPKRGRDPWNWELPFSSQRSRIWMDPLPFFPFPGTLGEPGVGISPSRPWEAALSLHYPCNILLFPDRGTKAWTDALKSTSLRADPMEKEKFLLLSPFPGWFLQHPSITQTSSVRNGIRLPSRAAQGIQGGWKTPGKGQFLPRWP